MAEKSNFVFKQWFSGFAVALLVMQSGLINWYSPSPSLLMTMDSPIPVNNTQKSWEDILINSSKLLGTTLGPILASNVGSKRTLSITLCPIAAGWLLTFMANWMYEWLHAGARVSLAIGLGMALSAFPLYLGEVSMPKIRGALIALATAGIPFGQLVGSSASLLNISTDALIYFGQTIILMCIFYFFLPESPHHLVKDKNRKDEAYESIKLYRDGREVDEELEAVEEFGTVNREKSFVDNLKELNTPAMKAAITRIIILFSLQQMCGLKCVLFFMETILKSSKFTMMKSSSVIIYGLLCAIISAITSIVLIDRCGRRVLLIISGAGVTISMLAFSGFFLLIKMGEIPKGSDWLFMISITLFMISFFVGLFPVPNTILSETFPMNIKSIAAITASAIAALISFITAKSYHPMVNYIGETWVFFIYAIFASLVIPYTLIAIPETKGKSLQQIQDELMNK